MFNMDLGISVHDNDYCEDFFSFELSILLWVWSYLSCSFSSEDGLSVFVTSVFWVFGKFEEDDLDELGWRDLV